MAAVRPPHRAPDCPIMFSWDIKWSLCSAVCPALAQPSPAPGRPAGVVVARCDRQSLATPVTGQITAMGESNHCTAIWRQRWGSKVCHHLLLCLAWETRRTVLGYSSPSDLYLIIYCKTSRKNIEHVPNASIVILLPTQFSSPHTGLAGVRYLKGVAIFLAHQLT